MKAKHSTGNSATLRRKLGSAACAAILACACSPLAAWADESEPGEKSTRVTVTTDESTVLKYSVPAIIPFVANGDGTLTGPSIEDCRIQNESVFGIHVTNVKVNPAGNWNLAADAKIGTSSNSIDFQFGPEKQIDAYGAMTGIDLSSDPSFNMDYQGGDKDHVDIHTAGDVARVTVDLSTGNAVDTATISWTVAAGSAAQS